MNMKKSLIALAVAGAFVAPTAMAETTVYGQMHLTIDLAKSGSTPAVGLTPAVASTSTRGLNSRKSRIGFKGTEDLGGISAIWQIESGIDADDGAGTLASRNTFLGLKSDGMGTILAGKHDTPYKMATRKLDVFANTAADNRAADNMAGKGMGAGHDLRTANTLLYMSPDMGGVSIAASTIFGAESAGAGDTKGSAYSLAAMFNMDQVYATVAYQTAKAGSTGSGDLAFDGDIFTNANPVSTTLLMPAVGDKANALKVGGGFSMDVFTVNAVLERLTYKPAGGGKGKNTNIYVGGKFNVSSSDALKVAYTKVGNTKADGDTIINGAKQMSVGFDHSMSANTTVYALFTKTKTNDTTTTEAADPSDISVGMKHSF